MSVAIKVENLSKVYRIGSRPAGYKTFRDTVAGLFERNGSQQKSRNEPFWALKNLSFEIKRGEVVGVIGRNGAGKSTLLKILSRITEPAEGFAEIRGRIGSLLEVGTGFHPELTGRENVFLNGAILGMRRDEIEKKFDEIVAFAEVEKFLDTPVKHYSSGMYLRLAFAVAAHLEPEILLVDEVLAVGDAQFQRKCLGKMGEVASRGRTVLFVSHNMSAIQSLCGRVICLSAGEIVADDVPAKCIASYFSTLDKVALPDLTQRQDRRGAGGVRMTRIDLVDPASGEPRCPVLGLPLRFLFRVSTMTPDLVCGFTIFDLHGVAVACFNTAAASTQDKIEPAAGPAFACDVDELPLAPGRYRITASLFRGPVLEDSIESACLFDVETGVMEDRPVLPMRGIGMVCIKHRWSTVKQESPKRASPQAIPSVQSEGPEAHVRSQCATPFALSRVSRLVPTRFSGGQSVSRGPEQTNTKDVGSQPTPTAITQLCRNPSQLMILANHLQAKREAKIRVTIWGVADGAEAVSLILACDPKRTGLRLEIRGYDIQGTYLEQARQFTFSPGHLIHSALPPWADGYWDFTDGRDRTMTLKPCWWPMVDYCQASVLDEPRQADLNASDLVMCQNVLISLPEQSLPTAVKNLACQVAPGGILAVGGGPLGVVHRLVLSHGFQPLLKEVENIHESWIVQRRFFNNPKRPYWALEPFDAKHPDGAVRFCTLFKKPEE